MAFERKNSAQDYNTAMEMALIVAVQMAAACKSYNKTLYQKEFINSLHSKQKKVESAMLQVLPGLEIGKPYSPSQFGEMIRKYSLSFSPADMSRALSSLVSDFNLEHIEGKENIKKHASKLGARWKEYHSAYFLPEKYDRMLRVYRNKELADMIVKLLVDTGILRMYLKNRVLPMLEIIRDDVHSEYREFFSSLFLDLKIEDQAYAKFRFILSNLNFEQLTEFANKSVEVLIANILKVPSFGQLLLVWGFSNPESIID